MKKLVVLLGAVIVAAGGYAHYHYWLTQSNLIKSHIEELAAGKNEQFRVSYDAVKIAGYPFRHEVLLENPCFYFSGSELSRSLTEGCLRGTMLLSYHPFSLDRTLFIETDGHLSLMLPKGDAEPTPLDVKGRLKQEYSFDPGYQFAMSSNLVYFLENLRKASLVAKDLTIATREEHAMEIAQNLSGTFEYSRKPEGNDLQRIQLFIDYNTLLGDAFQAYQPPFDKLFNAVKADVKAFNTKSGVNTGRYDATLVLPSWSIVKDVIDKIYSVNIDEIPGFSVDVDQSNRNNFVRSQGSFAANWERGGANGFAFKLKNVAFQDLTKEGEKEITSLLQAIARESVKMMVVSTEENHRDISKDLDSAHFEDLFKGFPNHMEMDLKMSVKKESGEPPKDHLSVSVDPLMVGTDKGSLTMVVDYKSNEPFSAKIDVDQLVRIVDGFITRYNIIVKVVDTEYGKKLPQITEMERNHFLAILQKYSDNPDKLPKAVAFTFTESSDGTIMIGKQQDIRALVGELAFFFQHLQQKVQKAGA